MDLSAGGSSTSPSTPSRGSRRSARASASSASPGEGAALGRRALKAIAARHGIRPKKSLGQHFLVDPNLARRIAEHASVGPGSNVVEVGAGLGSLTVALADLGASVIAVEIDRSIAEALEDVLGDRTGVHVLVADALRLEWGEVLARGPWTMASNLPYNVAVPLVVGMLERAPNVERFLVMVQREVGERLAAGPGEEAYGAVSVRVEYHAEARVVRRVPPSVFWPEPQVESVVVELLRRRVPPVATAPDRLLRVVDEGFAQRRKTMANALVRLGLSRPAAIELLRGAGIDERARAESLSIGQFASLAEGVPWNG